MTPHREAFNTWKQKTGHNKHLRKKWQESYGLSMDMKARVVFFWFLYYLQMIMQFISQKLIISGWFKEVIAILNANSMIYTVLLPSTRECKFLQDGTKGDSVLIATIGMATTQKTRKPESMKPGLFCLVYKDRKGQREETSRIFLEGLKSI